MKKKFLQPTTRGLYPISVITGIFLALAMVCVAQEYIYSLRDVVSSMCESALWTSSNAEASILLGKMYDLDIAKIYTPFSELMVFLRLPTTIPAVLFVCVAAGLFGSSILGTKKWRSKFIQSIGVTMSTLAAGIAANIMLGVTEGSPSILLLMTLVMIVLIILGLMTVRLTLSPKLGK